MVTAATEKVSSAYRHQDFARRSIETHIWNPQAGQKDRTTYSTQQASCLASQQPSAPTKSTQHNQQSLNTKQSHSQARINHQEPENKRSNYILKESTTKKSL